MCPVLPLTISTADKQDPDHITRCRSHSPPQACPHTPSSRSPCHSSLHLSFLLPYSSHGALHAVVT